MGFTYLNYLFCHLTLDIKYCIGLSTSYAKPVTATKKLMDLQSISDAIVDLQTVSTPSLPSTTTVHKPVSEKAKRKAG